MPKAFIILFVLTSPGLLAQESLQLGGMTMSYTIVGQQLSVTLEAPTQGWLGIGFNDRNAIVGSDLLLMHVIDNKAEVLDMQVKGIGNPKEDQMLGGTNNIIITAYAEKAGRTTISFSRPLNTQDPNDHPIERGEDLWLILAYSTHDDFGHHSRMRKHTSFTFE